MKDYIAIIISGISAVTAIVAILITWIWNSKKHTNDLINTKKLTLDTCDALLTKLTVDLPDELQILNTKSVKIRDPGAYLAEYTSVVYFVLNTYELTAIKYINNIIDREIFNIFFNRILIQAHNDLKLLIAHIRADQSDDVYSNFDKMIVLMKEYKNGT